MDDRCGSASRLAVGAVVVFAVVFTPLAGSPQAQADAFHDYALRSTFEMPVGSDRFDALPDGRLIAIVGDALHVETMAGSRQFQVLGSLPDADIPSFGAAFLEVSPDGQRIAVGNNGGSGFDNFVVGIFNLSDLSGEWFEAAHFLGAWVDDRDFAITAGDFGQPAFVTLLDTQSPDPVNPTNPVVVGNIGGASAGVAFDAAHRLYTGNGFAIGGPSGTGTIKAFEESAWRNAVMSGVPLDFESDGVLVIDILSADSLGFDSEGNLFVGGGDGETQNDFAAIAFSDAVAAALAGQGAIDPDDAAAVRRLDPDDTDDFNFYAVTYNPSAAELYVRNFDGSTVYVFSPNMQTVPSISIWGLFCLALSIAVTATLMLTRPPPAKRRRVPVPWRVGEIAVGGRSHA